MRARDKGRLLRQKYGLTRRVDVEALAEAMGLRIDVRDDLPPEDLHEITIGRRIAVSAEICDQDRRWAIAHGIGHRILHPGNHVWLRAHTMLTIPYERQAEEFAYGLLVDEAEAATERLPTLAHVADYFGVPMGTVLATAPEVWSQARLF